MRSFFIFGRLCGRRGSPFFQSAPRIRIPRHQQSFTRWTRKHSLKDPRQRGTPSLLATAAALSPAAFVQLGQNHEEGKTGEMHMLEVSRQELSKRVPEDVHGLRRVYKTVIYILD